MIRMPARMTRAAPQSTGRSSGSAKIHQPIIAGSRIDTCSKGATTEASAVSYDAVSRICSGLPRHAGHHQPCPNSAVRHHQTLKWRRQRKQRGDDRQPINDRQDAFFLTVAAQASAPGRDRRRLQVPARRRCCGPVRRRRTLPVATTARASRQPCQARQQEQPDILAQKQSGKPTISSGPA